MRIRWFGKTYIFGPKAKAQYRQELKDKLERATAEARKKGDATKPIDYGAEFAALIALSPESCFSDRALSARDRIITVTGYLAEQLRWLITIKLIGGRGRLPSRGEMAEVFDGYGPLASFANRISASFVLGMLSDDMKSDLRTLKGMRNDAAHSFKHLLFTDPALVAECKKLKLRLSLKEKFPTEAEQQFVESATMIMLALTHVGYLLMEQEKVLKANANTIIRNAALTYNESIAKTNLPRLDVPPEP